MAVLRDAASSLSLLGLNQLPMYLTYDCALSLRNFICLSSFSDYVLPVRWPPACVCLWAGPGPLIELDAAALLCI